MNKRPTIQDLAESAGVSVSTVNRVLAGADNVRDVTMQRIANAAEEIGFYGLGAIKSRIAASRPRYNLGIIMLQKNREFYAKMAQNFYAKSEDFADRQVDIEIIHLEDLDPDRAEAALHKLAKTRDAIAITFPQTPQIASTIESIVQNGTPVVSLITSLSASVGIGYVGIDNWKAGRTAAWAMSQLCKEAGEFAILVGNPRFRNQELNETGFRSYIREHNPEFKILEPITTYEVASIAQEVTLSLIDQHPNLKGIFIAGGGITGALDAIRKSNQQGKLISIGFELLDVTKRGLLDNALTLSLALPMDEFVRNTLQHMMNAVDNPYYIPNIQMEFQIYTKENI